MFFCKCGQPKIKPLLGMVYDWVYLPCIFVKNKIDHKSSQTQPESKVLAGPDLYLHQPHWSSGKSVVLALDRIRLPGFASFQVSSTRFSNLLIGS